jgi:hypothetical protein
MDDLLHHPTDPPPPYLWFGVVGAPVAWATQSLLGWFAGSVVCNYREEQSSVWFSAAGLHAIEIGVSTLAILVAVGALTTSIGAWREFAGRERAPAPYDFLASVAVFSSAIFLFGIVWAGMPLYMLAPCEPL